MNAPQLLETLTARGARLLLDGAALVVKPRDVLTDELRAEIRANKPALLVLLQHGDRFAESSALAPAPAAQPATPSPFRTVAPFLLVPANLEISAGASRIAATLQNFERTLAAARGGELPTDALTVEIDGEAVKVEKAAAACMALESTWTGAAQWCQKDGRDLTSEEAAALQSATAFLDEIAARWNGAAWLDLAAIDRQLDEDFAQMLQKQRKATP
jgi:hypothetical protein